MRTYRRILSLLFATLVVLSSSVFLFSEDAFAQDISIPEAERIIEQKKQLVNDKESVLTQANKQIENLEAKKISLFTELETIKNDVEGLKKQIADKRLAADNERKRVEELRAMFVHVKRYANDSAGNDYAPGNCTWYAKSRRRDLPNSLGNANTWYSRAASLGWNVGSLPKKGAVGTSTRGSLGHVVYVEGVSIDGQYATISEMNSNGLYSIRTRTAHYTEFKYIYELD